MLHSKLFLFLSVVACFNRYSSFVGLAYNVRPGPAVLATKGAIWPKPQEQDVSDKYLLVNCGKIEFKILEQKCEILERAINRYKYVIATEDRFKINLEDCSLENDLNFMGNLDTVEILLKNACEEWPHLGMDESYELHVVPSASKVSIESNSIWGVLKGLESFSQLLYIIDENKGLIAINETVVIDFPRFSHRGLLLDTSRHYLPVPVILETLGAMTYSKMNVFHWHIVDDQSFPYQSSSFPELSSKGAYHPKMIYTPADVQNIIKYAQDRGIRVMVEFDTPGHTRSWGEGVQKLLTTCYSGTKPNGYYGPIDPIRSSTYEFLHKFFKEVVTVFPEEYVHLGGDEVDFDCWESNPLIQKFMKDNNITSFSELEEIYIQKLVNIVDGLKAKSVVWEEVFVNGVKLPNETVVHVWKGEWSDVMDKATKAGLPVLLSSCWYLDHIAGGGDWEKYYTCDPFHFPSTPEQRKLVMGGEACMWAEAVDETNVISRVWPRACATAERLWSDQHVTDTNEASRRLEEHTCRMRRRGIMAQPPNGPGFCL